MVRLFYSEPRAGDITISIADAGLIQAQCGDIKQIQLSEGLKQLFAATTQEAIEQVGIWTQLYGQFHRLMHQPISCCLALNIAYASTWLVLNQELNKQDIQEQISPLFHLMMNLLMINLAFSMGAKMNAAPVQYV